MPVRVVDSTCSSGCNQERSPPKLQGVEFPKHLAAAFTNEVGIYPKRLRDVGYEPVFQFI